MFVKRPCDVGKACVRQHLPKFLILDPEFVPELPVNFDRDLAVDKELSCEPVIAMKLAGVKLVIHTGTNY